MKNARVNEIMSKMTSFDKERYTKAEMLDEVFKLQNEMAVIAFGEETGKDKRFYDIAALYSDKNTMKNNVVDELVEDVRRECGEATNWLRGLVSGQKGESKTFYKLNELISQHSIRKNIEIGNIDKRTEIDALVVTEKAAFIIEVKNTKRDAFIDSDGQYYRTGDYMNWDSNLGRKLALRENFVRKAAEKSGITDLRIEKIVVFTDNRIRVQNKCNSIRTSFLNQLTSMIDNYEGQKIITVAEIENLMETIDSMTTVFEYRPEIDVQQFKANFAELVVTLDHKEETKNEKATGMWRTIITTLKTKRPGSIAAAIGAIVATSILH